MLLSQAAGGGGDLTNVATLITQIGLSAVFLWLWWTERKERQEQQATIIKLMERALPALAESTDVLDRVQTTLTNQIARNSPDNRAVDLALRRLELLTDELGSSLHQTRRRREDYDTGPV